jgi:hypothetical protein
MTGTGVANAASHGGRLLEGLFYRLNMVWQEGEKA